MPSAFSPSNTLNISNSVFNFFSCQEWCNCGLNTNLKFPLPNPFIPTDFTLYAVDDSVKPYPVILHDTPVMRVWFKQDTEFLKPKTIMNFHFTSPLAYSDPLNCNLTHMFVQLYKDQLNEYLYEAELAGLRFNVSNTANGVSVSESHRMHHSTHIHHIFGFPLNSCRSVATAISKKYSCRRHWINYSVLNSARSVSISSKSNCIGR